MDLEDAFAALGGLAAAHSGLRLLLLHGSRSRQRAHAGSDWDLGYLAADDFDPVSLHADVSHALGTDQIDLVDLSRASALLRFEAARYGRSIYVSTDGAHEDFVLEATIFWCDVEPVIRRAHAAVLSELSA